MKGKIKQCTTMFIVLPRMLCVSTTWPVDEQKQHAGVAHVLLVARWVEKYVMVMHSDVFFCWYSGLIRGV